MASEAPTANIPLLSIVIPAYNEETRLPISLPAIIEFVNAQDYAVQVLVVDDGSADRTAEVVREFQREAEFIELLQVEHGGKGHAVRAGMLQAGGDYLFLCDADLSMPIVEVSKFLPPELEHFDIAIGSREVAGAKRYDEPWQRHVMGRVFNALVNLLAVPGIQDTQAGFKCFRRDVARHLFALQTIKGWAFDVEILFLARKQGLNIVEVPINWYYQDESRVKPLRDTYRMLSELLRIRLNAWRNHPHIKSLRNRDNETLAPDSLN